MYTEAHEHTHSTPDGGSIVHSHERPSELHHHGWHRATDPQPDGSTPEVPWIAADEGVYFDDKADQFGVKRRHTPEVIGMQRVFEIPVVFVMTGFDNEYDAAAEAIKQVMASGIEHGRSPVDAITFPAHLDLTEADDRAGTIVYGKDNRLICRALTKLRAFVNPNDTETVQDIDRLIGYLSEYTFNGL